MARNLSYYVDPEEERRKLGLVADTFGPEPPPNIGVAPVPRIPMIEAPTEEEVAAEQEAEAEQEAPAAGERARYEDARPLDILLEPGPIEKLGAGALSQRIPLTLEERRQRGLPATLSDVGGAANPFEEEAQARAAAEERPEAVDESAASVGDAQKGVPSARLSLGTDVNAERGWADTLLEQVQKRVFDKPESSADPLTQKATDVASRSLDPAAPGYRERASAAAMAAYGEDTPPSTRWEDELLRERGTDRLTDAQIRRRSAVMDAFGDPGAGARWAQTQQSANTSFAQEREKARDRDHKETRISRALAAAIAQQGVPPEEAVKLKYGDDLVKAFTNGMYSQGLRAEGQALGREKAQMQHAFDLIKSGKTDDRERGLAMFRGLVQLGSAELRNQALAMAADLPPEMRDRLLGTLMASTLGVTPEKGAAVAQGNTSGLTPEQTRKAEIAQPTLEESVRDPKIRRELLKDRAKALANAEQKTENVVEQARALAQDDRKFAVKWQGEWMSAYHPIRNAISSWSKMSPAGQKAFVEFTQTQRSNGVVDMLTKEALDAFKKAFVYAPGDQVHASRVLEALNTYVKANAGSAVTGSEWDRIAARTGMATGNWAPFNDPAVIEQFLRDAAAAMTADRADYERIMGSWK